MKEAGAEGSRQFYPELESLRGLAALIGWERVNVPTATGYLDTDYAAKGRAAVSALPTTDVVCVHIEAPDRRHLAVARCKHVPKWCESDQVCGAVIPGACDPRKDVIVFDEQHGWRPQREIGEQLVTGARS